MRQIPSEGGRLTAAVEGDIAVNLNGTSGPATDNAQSGGAPDRVVPGAREATTGPDSAAHFPKL